MNQKKLTSRVYSIAKAMAAGAALPVFFIYIMVAKPDYHVMNAAAHIVVPVGSAIGDVITWPVRGVRNMIVNIHELSALRRENAEMRAELAALRMRGAECDTAMLENQKLSRELDIVHSTPNAVAADVMHDNSALYHNTYFISKGSRDGIEPGQVAVTFDGMLAGIVIDAAPGFARVRALTDGDTNIAVRVAGAEVYGFMRGTGGRYPTMGFFNDTEFQPTRGIRLITSGIGGALPDGILVGTMENDTDVRIKSPGSLSRVMILKHNNAGRYTNDKQVD
ncbi:rod shape-determining protein MreC [bacterium]|nr:rod shape-determining protein MreC [bacterium]